MTATYSPRLRKAILKRRAKPSQQFGQADDYYTFGGATGCTHVVLQWLIWLWKGKWVSQDALSKIAGYPLPGRNPYKRGLRPSEVQRIVDHFALPYQIKFGLTAAEVRRASERGPVGFAMAYSHYPEWKGYRYGGLVADGRPNGFASPLGKAGKSQLSGFTGAHFGLLLGVAVDPSGPDKVYSWEPNHGSAARPEKPPYDIMNVAQFDKVFDSYRTQLGRSTYALIPTKALPAVGY